ncbi:MAG: hypothetical protein WAW86_06260 [Gammaproteobacteria bacterium]
MFRQKKLKSFDELMSLAQHALQIVREKMTSSHHFISRTTFPHITLENIPEIVPSVGAANFLHCLNYQNKLILLREASRQCSDLLDFSDLLAINITAAQFGVGECEEHASLALYELFKLDHQLVIRLLTLNMGQHDNHFILLLGDSTKIEPGGNINKFSELDDQCVFIDPFLNIAGKANCMQALTGDYLTANECTHVGQALALTTNIIDLPALTNKISHTFDAVSEKLDVLESQIHDFIYPTLQVLFSIDDPFCRFMKTFKNMCDQTPDGTEILAASLKSLPLAFRKACAYGKIDLVEFILQHQTTLHPFDINEPSAIGYTALDWAHTIQDHHLKEQMIARLEAHGALTSEQETKQPLLGK